MIRFTKEEKIVLLFLLTTLFVGTGVLCYKKVNSASSAFTALDEKEIEKPARVDINKATKEELMRIKGIGTVLAEGIISHRQKYGPFQKAEDIKKVKGIGNKTFEKIRKDIILE